MIKSTHPDCSRRGLTGTRSYFKYVLNHIRDGMMLADPQGIICDVNTAFLTMTNARRKDVIGRHCYEINPHPDKHCVLNPSAHCPINIVIKNGQPVRTEHTHFTPEGKKIFVEMYTFPIYDSSGKIQLMAALFHDLTDQRQAEDALRRLTDYLSNIVNGMAESIMVTDRNYLIKDVNDQLLKLYQTTRDKVIGLPCYKVSRGYEKPCQNVEPGLVCPHTEVFKTGRTVTTEHIHRDSSGNRLIEETYSFPVFGEGEKVDLMVDIFHDVTARRRAETDLKRAYRKLQEVTKSIIYGMVKLVRTKDPATAAHQERTSRIAQSIGRQMKLSPERIKGIQVACRLHDISKIYIPPEVLDKCGHLTKKEMGLIKTHPQVAYDILKLIEFPWPVAEIIYQHHEWFDGSGYPRGVSGKQIPLEARILSAADALDAMTSRRAYHKPLTMNQALKELASYRGIRYDPAVVDACIKLCKKKGFNYRT
ncbi:MAG: PAS domain-containing protein [Planctomycetes bacterium]|nr:PAS domain-containing protein [Planctomycetota bacterium]